VSNEEALAKWEAWKVKLMAASIADDDPPELATTYLAEFERAVDGYWEARGGEFTPRRRAALARRLGKLQADCQLFAIELYVDKHRTKDERYCVPIAERLARSSDSEFEFELATHRRTCPNGLHAL
jgi:hypothetical protein